jgi:hypothetical protein
MRLECAFARAFRHKNDRKEHKTRLLAALQETRKLAGHTLMKMP